jgi:hypothetical protein
MNFRTVYEKAVFQSVYENAKKAEQSLREDDSYELVDPVVGLQPTKKVAAMSRNDNQTEYLHPDGTNVEDWYAP